MNIQNISNQMNFKSIASFYRQDKNQNIKDVTLKRISDDVIDLTAKKNNLSDGFKAQNPGTTPMTVALTKSDIKFAKEIMKKLNFKQSDLGKIKEMTVMDGHDIQIIGQKGTLAINNGSSLYDTLNLII